jgi:hypothetical protein
MKTEPENRPTNVNPMIWIMYPGTKSQQTDSAAIKIKGALTKMDETHS